MSISRSYFSKVSKGNLPLKFSEILTEANAWLQREGRSRYRFLQREYGVSDETLVRTGSGAPAEIPVHTSATQRPSSSSSVQPKPQPSVGERRQSAVMFCDLVNSTTLSEQLYPGEPQTVVRTYQEVSAQVIERHEGHIAQYLGNSFLVYFAYPSAHEDDAACAIRAVFEIVSSLHEAHSQFPQPMLVRIGIHTGPVVVGQMESS